MYFVCLNLFQSALAWWGWVRILLWGQKIQTPSSSSAFLAISLGFTIFDEIFEYVTVFKKKKKRSNCRGSHILSSWTVYAGCVSVAGIGSSTTWMSGSVEPPWRNACVHRLDLHLYSYLKEFQGKESEPTLTPREISPLLEAHRKVEPAMLHHAGQQAKHTTDWATLAPIQISNPTCSGQIIPVTPPGLVPGLTGSVLGLVGPVKLYCDWVRLRVWQ